MEKKEKMKRKEKRVINKSDKKNYLIMKYKNQKTKFWNPIF
jgi:hypothetical protein